MCSLKEPRNYNCTLFIYKNKRKKDKHFKLFFLVFLHFGTSNYLHIEKQIYSFHFVLSSLEIQRRDIQTKYTTSFLPCLKRNDSQTFQSTTAKNFFWSFMLLLQLTLIIIFSLCDNWKTLFFYQSLSIPLGIFNTIFSCFLTEVIWKKFFFFILHKKSTKIIPKWKFPK